MPSGFSTDNTRKRKRVCKNLDEEVERNLVGFMRQLVEVDMRLHPELYEEPENDTENICWIP